MWDLESPHSCVASVNLPSGTNLHRAIGATYVLTMFGLNVTAVLIYRVFGRFGAFHIRSAINLVLLLRGFGTVLLQRPSTGVAAVGLLLHGLVVRRPRWGDGD